LFTGSILLTLALMATTGAAKRFCAATVVEGDYRARMSPLRKLIVSNVTFSTMMYYELAQAT
jgi:hypothetical protein